MRCHHKSNPHACLHLRGCFALHAAALPAGSELAKLLEASGGLQPAAKRGVRALRNIAVLMHRCGEGRQRAVACIESRVQSSMLLQMNMNDDEYDACFGNGN